MAGLAAPAGALAASTCSVESGSFETFGRLRYILGVLAGDESWMAGHDPDAVDLFFSDSAGKETAAAVAERIEVVCAGQDGRPVMKVFALLVTEAEELVAA
jgi:hypothetical protein